MKIDIKKEKVFLLLIFPWKKKKWLIDLKPQEPLPDSQYVITFILVGNASSEQHLEACRFIECALLNFKS